MIHSDLDALLQGALDNSLTPEEQDRLARMISESGEARARAAEFEQLTGLIESLGPANPPPGLVEHVLAQVSHRPYAVRPSTFERGVTVNKKILFGLAAAAAIVLAVITYNSYPRPIEGTEATIGAAQRAQTPQITAQDVKLGDTSTQTILQTETFDAIMKDETLRTMLQDAEVRVQLTNALLRNALADENIRAALLHPNFVHWIQDPELLHALTASEMRYNFDDANMKVMLSNKAFVDALRISAFRVALTRDGFAAALAGPALQRALIDQGFDAALKSPLFVAQLRAVRANQ
jgi:hypothetical protein